MGGKKRASAPAAPFDFERFGQDLRSPDPARRARAARDICPCRLGWEVFERCMTLVEPLRKDPDAEVRRAALHVFEDAFEMQSRGLPTTPREITNEMVARRRANKWGDDRDDGEATRTPPRAGNGRPGWRGRHLAQDRER